MAYPDRQIEVFNPRGVRLAQGLESDEGLPSGIRVSSRKIIITDEEQAQADMLERVFEDHKRSQPWSILDGKIFVHPRNLPYKLRDQEAKVGERVGEFPSNTRVIRFDEMREEGVSNEVAGVLETFYVVERYLPDFAAAAMSATRRFGGAAKIYYQWVSEENQHEDMTRRILLTTRVGKEVKDKEGDVTERIITPESTRTPQQLRNLDKKAMTREWMQPFMTLRLMQLYAFFQEDMTKPAYETLIYHFEEWGARIAATGLKLVYSDESFHRAEFKDFVEGHAKLDPKGTEEDLYFVVSHFHMPADFIAPDKRRRAMELRKVLGVSREAYARRLLKAMKDLSFVDQERALETAAVYAGIDPKDRAKVDEVLLTPPQAGKL